MTTQDKIANIMSDIWYQHPFWPSTFSECANNGCQESARGGRECKECLKKQLSALTSEESATKFYQLLANVRECEHELVYGEHKNKPKQ